MALNPYFALSFPNLMCVHQCLQAHMCVCIHIHNLTFHLIEQEKIVLSEGLIFQHSVQEHFKYLTLSTDLNKAEESNKWILRITHTSMTRALNDF